MELATRLPILDEAVCISLLVYVLEKSRKYISSRNTRQLWVNSWADWIFLALVGQSVKVKENSELRKYINFIL